mmetsp:Transcript_13339/g.56822  ORF Transcript_13339/g.56822 Transcript_13339/m.56822 type:complete len:249 (-) Transcript_13339:306-1052(-)
MRGGGVSREREACRSFSRWRTAETAERVEFASTNGDGKNRGRIRAVREYSRVLRSVRRACVFPVSRGGRGDVARVRDAARRRGRRRAPAAFDPQTPVPLPIDGARVWAVASVRAPRDAASARTRAPGHAPGRAPGEDPRVPGPARRGVARPDAPAPRLVRACLRQSRRRKSNARRLRLGRRRALRAGRDAESFVSGPTKKKEKIVSSRQLVGGARRDARRRRRDGRVSGFRPAGRARVASSGDASRGV